MKTSKYPLYTLRSCNNKDDVVLSLMIRGGMIRKLSSGIFIFLPNGLKIINNIISVVKIYMKDLNVHEFSAPVLSSYLLWKSSGRIKSYGKELFKIIDRNNKLFLLSPTSEELIADFFCKEVDFLSYFPSIFYQVGNKYRDEVRPKSGILRSKEFIMKDSYSFHLNDKCLSDIYYKFMNIYIKIFNYFNLDVFYKKADCGKIGGYLSHEFHVKSDYGENVLSLRKINLNVINKLIKSKKNILDFSFFLKKDNFLYYIFLKKYVSTILIEVCNEKKISYLVVLIPFSKSLDKKKIKNIFPFYNKINVCNEEFICNLYNVNYFYFGPYGIYNYKIIVDISLLYLKNFILGSGLNNYFHVNVNWNVCFGVYGFFDICNNVNEYIKKNDCNNSFRSIELGHIFKLGYKYTSKYEHLINKKILMGCYGIGLTRLMFVIAENNYDSSGIIWPNSIASFKIAIVPIGMYLNNKVKFLSFKIYNFMLKNNIDVILDDRNIYLGRMLTDLELMGIPNILIISKKSLLFNILEFRDRVSGKIFYINYEDLFNYILSKFK